SDQRAHAVERDGLPGERERGVDVPRRGRHLFLGGWVVVEVALGQPDAADVDRDGRRLAVRRPDQLGGAAADVRDEVRLGDVGTRGQLPGGTRVRQRRLLLTGDDLGVDAEDLPDAGDELGRVLRVPGGAGR